MKDNRSKIEKRKMEARKRQAKLRKRANSRIKPQTRKRIAWAAVLLAVVLIAAGVLFANSSLAMRTLTAAKIGDVKVSPAEYSYYYLSSYTNYSSMMQSLYGGQNTGIDTAVSLKKQYISEGTSYADYFSDEALSSLQRLIAVSEAAKAEGYQLSEEEQADYDSAVATMRQNAEAQDMSLDEYIGKNIVKGMNFALYQKMLEREFLAGSYEQHLKDSYEYSDEDLEAYYQENIDNYAKIDYRLQPFLSEEETETSEGVTLEEAKKKAEDFLSKITDEASFSEAAIQIAKEKLSDDSETEAADNSLRTGSTKVTVRSIDGNLADWAFAEERGAGDFDLIENEDGTGYYVAYIIQPQYRDEFTTRDVRHILFAVDSDSEEDWEKAKSDAEAVYQEWKDGEATEDSFAELAKRDSDDSSADNGGLIEGIAPGQTVSAFDAWVFDDARRKGDTEVIETEYGYHVLYYVGEDDTPYWKSSVRSAMISRDYSAWYEEQEKTYPIDKKGFGMLFRVEPF